MIIRLYWDYVTHEGLILGEDIETECEVDDDLNVTPTTLLGTKRIGRCRFEHTYTDFPAELLPAFERWVAGHYPHIREAYDDAA